MNILIVKLSAIGDVIHTLPALNAIRKEYPDAHITWLVEEGAAGIVEGHRALDRVLVSKRKHWIKGIWSKSCLNTIKEALYFIKELRDTRYDVIFDFQALLKSGILIGLARGKRKIGFNKGMEHMEHSYVFLNERIPPVAMDNHALLRNMMLLDAIGIPASEIEFKLPVFDQDYLGADDLLTQHGVKEYKLLVAINPVAKWATKLWSNEKFAKLADRLIEKYEAGIVFTGGPEDRGSISDIMSCMKSQSFNLAGATSLKTLAALYEKSALLVSTDTGPMHIAAAVETPVVALFGPTAPWRTGPFGDGHQIVRAGLECSPCFKRQCKTTECMKQISVERVFATAMAVIDGRQAFIKKIS
ncbi:MAG: lipopolysaccharide heptosyltransferase II [Deltaproteobacteria bacterium CG1_02_45_11]|nr:MAG: lipopolysaccharide heptosyltransferase II [Deltaproteobacteria bacterium CG1_02_45_11]